VKTRLEPVFICPLRVVLVVWPVPEPHRVGFAHSELAVGNVLDGLSTAHGADDGCDAGSSDTRELWL